MTTYYCDTNIILRILTSDNPRYKLIAESFIKKAISNNWQLIITLATIWELEYALTKRYSLPKTEVVKYLKSITSDPAYTLEESAVIINAIKIYSENDLDLIDNVLISKQNLNSTPIATFDKKLANTSPDNLLLHSQT